jgi:N6-L-threonylcarbamoyladenine synthase
MGDMKVLGIETSCDETAAAIVTERREILANIVLSQTEEHRAYGGVVPEIAARAHAHHLDDIIRKALAEAQCSLRDMDAIAVTGGPGLIGGVIVGVMAAKAIAAVTQNPFIAVNHLEGHALTTRLTDDVAFPYLLLLVSGGHCQLLAVEGVGKYRKLGGTLDDALGEAFDKTAKMMGLGYPGGPAIEMLAKQGNANRYRFSIPLQGRADSNFSFSGLKTSLRQEILALDAAGNMNNQTKADICASFQATVAEILRDRLQHGLRVFCKEFPDAKRFVVAGGVAANHYLRDALAGIAGEYGMELIVPPVSLCTDNAAMIAWAGLERFRLGMTDALDYEPRARWPLDDAAMAG